MFSSTGFAFNGVSSSTYKLIIGRIETGLVQAPYGVNRSLVKDRIKSNYKSILYHANYEPLTFSITMTLDDDVLANRQWTKEVKKNIATWLFTDTYKDFKSDDDTTITYKCMPINAERFINGLDEGYSTLTFECDSPFAYTTSSTPVAAFDLRTASPILATIPNPSNIPSQFKFYPEIQVIAQEADCDVTITNTTTSETLILTGLANNEDVYLRGNRRQVLSSESGIFTKWNKVWIHLANGDNEISVSGDDAVVQISLAYCPIMI
jgi:phage-related protein